MFRSWFGHGPVAGGTAPVLQVHFSDAGGAGVTPRYIRGAHRRRRPIGLSSLEVSLCQVAIGSGILAGIYGHGPSECAGRWSPLHRGGDEAAISTHAAPRHCLLAVVGYPEKETTAEPSMKSRLGGLPHWLVSQGPLAPVNGGRMPT
jgi:hypothetical protein